MTNIVRLSELANGAADEKFNRELKRVLANIADPNTDAKKTRKITLEIAFQGDEKRDVLFCGIKAKSTVQPAKEVLTKFVMGTESDGEIVAKELVSGEKGQTFFDVDGKTIASDTGEIIIDFRKKAE